MSRSLTQIVLEIVEETKNKYYDDVGDRDIKDTKRFIQWYIDFHDGPIEIMLYDLEHYYLHLKQSTILRYLNE